METLIAPVRAAMTPCSAPSGAAECNLIGDFSNEALMQTMLEIEHDAPSAQTAPAQSRVYTRTILAMVATTRLAVVWIAIFRDPSRRLFNIKVANLAHHLLAGQGLSSPFGGSTGPSAFLAPGYPALLATIFRVAGDSSVASAAVVMLLQAAIAVITAWVIMRVAQRELGAETANIAGICWAIGPPLIWMSTLLWETSLSTLLLIGLIAIALRCRREPGKAIWVVMGAYCGLAMLVNPSLTLAFLAILGWTAYHTRSASRYNPWLCLIVLLSVFAPWPIRNARALHAFVPFRSNLGFELWQGNRPGGNGFFDLKLDLEHNKREFDDYAAKGEMAYMRDKSAQAKASIRANPTRFVQLTAKRFACFWTGVDSPRNPLVIAHIALSSLLAFVGLIFLARKRPSLALLLLLPLLIFPLPYYVTHPDFRFREVLDPIALILGAYAFAQCDEALKRSQKQAPFQTL